jgi:hypothetical protein
MRPLDCFAALAMTGGELARLFLGHRLTYAEASAAIPGERLAFAAVRNHGSLKDLDDYRR